MKEFLCIRCRRPLSLSGTGKTACAGCAEKYEYGPKYLKTDPDRLLFEKFGKKYLLYKALNNNGFISYQLLKEGSISLPDRADVQRFREYILKYVKSGRLLDAGCGVMDVPGYLDFPDKSGFDLYGLDPINSSAFKWKRVVGCSEFTPFKENFFDAVIFATSLDHTCSLEQTMAEAMRIIKKGGHVVIWMSDRTQSFYGNIREKISSFLRGCKSGGTFKEGGTYRRGRYVMYPNKVVLYVPQGGSDPFHSYNESPKMIISKMKKYSFKLIDNVSNNRNEIFLCFTKSDGTNI